MKNQATANNKLGPTDILTPPCRLSFPALFVPKPVMKNKANAAVKYQATILIPPTVDLQLFTNVYQAAVKERWPNKPPKFKADKYPIRDCSEKDLDGYEEGWHYINAKSGYAPIVVDRQRQPVLDKEMFYPGCWCYFHLKAFGWDYEGVPGVSFGLQGVMFCRDDERFDVKGTAEVFDAIGDDEDPTA